MSNIIFIGKGEEKNLMFHKKITIDPRHQTKSDIDKKMYDNNRSKTDEDFLKSSKSSDDESSLDDYSKNSAQNKNVFENQSTTSHKNNLFNKTKLENLKKESKYLDYIKIMIKYTDRL